MEAHACGNGGGSGFGAGAFDVDVFADGNQPDFVLLDGVHDGVVEVVFVAVEIVFQFL